MSDAEFISRVNGLLKTRYAGCSFAFLHGSRVHGTSTPESDVDLIVVFDGNVKPYREFFNEDGYSYDVFVYDIQSLYFLVCTAKKSGRTAVLTILNTSLTLPAATKTSSHLLATSKAVDSAPLEVGNTEHLRMFVGNLLSDLKKSKEQFEIYSLSIELYKLITEYTLIEKGIGGSMRKYINKAMKENVPDLHLQLNDAIREVFVSGNLDALIGVGQATLDRLGGALGSDFKMLLPEGGRLPLPVDL